MFSYAMAIHLASTFANGKVPHHRMHLKKLVKIWELYHMWAPLARLHVAHGLPLLDYIQRLAHGLQPKCFDVLL